MKQPQSCINNLKKGDKVFFTTYDHRELKIIFDRYNHISPDILMGTEGKPCYLSDCIITKIVKKKCSLV